jgi:hypothetical protein
MKLRYSLFAALIGASLTAGPLVADAEESPVAGTVTMTIFRNGGIGKEDADTMRHEAREFSLRLAFSEGPNKDFIADVPVVIADARGNRIFAHPDAGPLLYVMLPEGRYTVTARSDGVTKTQEVTLFGNQGKDVVFHWNTAAGRVASHASQAM